MYRRYWILLLLSFFVLATCSENIDPRTPDGAMHQIRNAIMERDAAAVLDNASSKTHDLLVELQALLLAQARAIEEKYPANRRVPARAAYPVGTLEATSPDALFAALVSPHLIELEMSDGLAYGTSVAGLPRQSGDRATVSTHGGETIEFVLENGSWKTTAFERILARNLDRVRLNQETLDRNLTIFAEIERRAAERAASAAASRAAPPADAAPPPL